MYFLLVLDMQELIISNDVGEPTPDIMDLCGQVLSRNSLELLSRTTCGSYSGRRKDDSRQDD